MKFKKYFFGTTLLFISLFSNNLNAQMFWNQACNFAGSNSSYVAVRHSPELNIVTSFTIEAWVNPVNVTSPSFQIILQKRGAGADGYTLYLSNGRVAIRTGAVTRLTGTGVIPNNEWTHIAGTFNSATNTFNTYINGFSDAGIVVAGAAPPANTDSVWIGKGNNDPFRGKMDEVRIWNRILTPTEVYRYRRTSLGASNGPYSGIALSMTFQDNDNNGAPFSLTDWSSNGNTGINRGVTGFDMSNRPLTTIQMNDCIELDGSTDYLTAPDNSNISPTSRLTLSAWIFPRSTASSTIIHKGSATGGPGTNYRLAIFSGQLGASINGNFIFSDDSIPLNAWTHVAFVYYGPTSTYQFYKNGEMVFNGSLPGVGNITDGPDSLYIGGTPNLNNFNGYIDEARIISDIFTSEEINNFMFKSIDLSNQGIGPYVVYNFDGYAWQNAGGTIPLLRFNGNSGFAHCGSENDQPQSPMNRADNLNFENSFYIKKSDRRIPETGSSGDIITDSLEILRDVNITDLNVFIALNHNQEEDLQIFVFPPNGGVAQLIVENSLVVNADHVITIFDDQADSSLNNSRYVNYSTRIKPYLNMNGSVSGNLSKGIWKLVIHDVINTGSTVPGRVYAWGIQINNLSAKPYLLNVSNVIQGFYDPATDLMIRDTMKYYLRNNQFPYSIVDSSKKYLTTAGFAQIAFTNAASGVPYYLQLTHRNSIETWSNPFLFDPLTNQAVYNFKNSITQAFGSNMIQVDNSPLTFAIYGGDVNQTGEVDASDVSAIDNDAFNFVTGYVNTDVTGDNVTDASDYALADNNAFNFVTKIVPPGALINPVSKDNNSDKDVRVHSSQDLNIDNEINKAPYERIKTSEEK